MPTYTNTSNGIVDIGSLVFKSGEQKSSIYILTSGDLRLDSELPYYQPVSYDEVVTATAPGKEVSLSLNDGTLFLSNLESSGNIQVFFNSLSNTPGFRLLAGKTYKFLNDGRLNKIYLVGTGSVNVKSIKGKHLVNIEN